MKVLDIKVDVVVEMTDDEFQTLKELEREIVVLPGYTDDYCYCILNGKILKVIILKEQRP